MQIINRQPGQHHRETGLLRNANDFADQSGTSGFQERSDGHIVDMLHRILIGITQGDPGPEIVGRAVTRNGLVGCHGVSAESNTHATLLRPKPDRHPKRSIADGV